MRIDQVQCYPYAFFALKLVLECTDNKATQHLFQKNKQVIKSIKKIIIKSNAFSSDMLNITNEVYGK